MYKTLGRNRENLHNITFFSDLLHKTLKHRQEIYKLCYIKIINMSASKTIISSVKMPHEAPGQTQQLRGSSVTLPLHLKDLSS